MHLLSTSKNILLILFVLITTPKSFSDENSHKDNSSSKEIVLYSQFNKAQNEDINHQEEAVLKEMIENPQKYHSEIEDITKGHPSGHGMTQEMLRFYTAVAIVESISCTVNNDPTGCELFLESLKDPIGHVGFAAFMLSAKKTSEYAMIMSQGKIPQVIAGNLGLMVGMLVQDLIVELVRDPLVAELMGLAVNKNYSSINEKIERANKIKNELWNKTFGSSEWRGDKSAHGLSLLAAVALSSYSQRILSAGAAGIAKNIIKRRRGLNSIRVGYRLGKFVKIGGRLFRSITPIGLSMTGVIIFLEWANVTEKFIAHPMRVRNAIFHRAMAQKELESLLLQHIRIDDATQKLSIKYLKERAVELEKASRILVGFNAKLDDMAKNFYNVTKYYMWLINGMDKDVYDKNEKSWHPEKQNIDLAFYRNKMLNGLFCGEDPKMAIKVQKEYAGLPIPFKEYEVSNFMEQVYKEIKALDASESNIRGVVIHPYKGLDIKGVCPKDIILLNKEKFDSLFGVSPYQKIICPVKNIESDKYVVEENQTSYIACQVNTLFIKEQILKTGMLNGKNIRPQLKESHLTAMTKVMKKYETLRMAYIKRYERRIFKTLLEQLTGQEFEVLNYRFKNSYGVYTSVYFNTDPKCTSRKFTLGNKEYPDVDPLGFRPSFNPKVVEAMWCSGTIPNLYQEIDYFQKLLKKAKIKEQKKVIEKALFNAKMQIKYALKLKAFYETELSDRKRLPDFELMFTFEDWVNMVKLYDNFILTE